MAITLEEARKNVQDDLQIGVIDEFRKSNWILDHITFDDAVSPTGGGATPTYSYTRLKTQPTAQFREINKEYTPHEVTKERHSVDIKVFGGSYQIDRVIANMGGGGGGGVVLYLKSIYSSLRKSRQLRHYLMIPLLMVTVRWTAMLLMVWKRHWLAVQQNTILVHQLLIYPRPRW